MMIEKEIKDVTASLGARARRETRYSAKIMRVF